MYQSTARSQFLKLLAQTNDYPLALEIDRAEGIYIYDKQGKKYVDLISGISVSSLGHNNESIKKATKLQIDKYMHTMVYGEYVQNAQVEYAETLTTLLPESLNCVYFTNSGAEACEGAMKLAKRITGRPNFVAFKKAYHGSTQGALSLAGDEFLRNSFRPLLPGIEHIEYNSITEFNAIDASTAAVIVEPIQAEAGTRIPSKGYLKALKNHCKKVGALLILDEIQTGFNRTGSMFAFEQEDFVPDILLLGKALGGGMPLGAFISSFENMKTFRTDPILGHITTFGGHPVSCAAGNAFIKELQNQVSADSVKDKSDLFKTLLSAHKVYGNGLLLSIQLQNFDVLQRVIKQCMDHGVLTDWFLFNDSSLRIAPPLIIEEETIKEVCSLINHAINAH